MWRSMLELRLWRKSVACLEGFELMVKSASVRTGRRPEALHMVSYARRNHLLH